MPQKKKPISKLSRTARYYRTGSTVKGKSKPKNAKRATKVKDAKSKSINSRPNQRKKRSELSTVRRKAKRSGKDIKNKDYDHATGKFVNSSVNRGRTKGTKGDSNSRGKKRKRKK